MARRNEGSAAAAHPPLKRGQMEYRISPTEIYMAGRGRDRRRGRSNSSTAVAPPPPKPAEAAKSNNNSRRKDRPKKEASNTGRLRKLTPLQPASEILARAQRLTHNEIKDDRSIGNIRRRVQKRGAQTVDSLSQKLCAPLKAAVQTYRKELRGMHPFESVVMELTVRARQKRDGLYLSDLLEEIHEGRKEILQLSKDWIAKIKGAPTAKEAADYTEEAKNQLASVYTDLIAEPYKGVAELQKSFRNVPMVRLDCPAVVLVGAPNVGKSSIVRAISSGTPEVNNYPFTTRGMTLGHVQVFWESDADAATGNVAGVSVPSEKEIVQERLLSGGVRTRRTTEREALEEYSREGADGARARRAQLKSSFPVSQLCQIMDSPGILRRPESEARNEMEELTIAAMAHLPTAVMYVMDLSGGAGDRCSSLEDQLVLRKQIRGRFPRRPWIDVVSKSDLGIVDGARERLDEILEEEGRQRGGEAEDLGFIELSIKEGQGVGELRQEVMRVLGEVRVVLDAMAARDERSARAV